MSKASKKPEEFSDDDFDGESDPEKKDVEKKLMEKVKKNHKALNIYCYFF